MQLDAEEGDHYVNVFEQKSGSLVGRINLYYAFPSESEVRQYDSMSIDSIAVFDDNMLRFGQDTKDARHEYKDPNLLLHIGVAFDMKEWVGDDWSGATENNQHNARTVLVFSKDLTRFEQDPSVYRQTLELKAAQGQRLPYSLERGIELR
jgi:hypothetical protein